MENVEVNLTAAELADLKSFCNDTGISVESIFTSLAKKILKDKCLSMEVAASVKVSKEENPLHFIGKCDPADIVKVIAKLPLFNQAVIISLIPSYKSSLLVQYLPEEMQISIMKTLSEEMEISKVQLDGIIEDFEKRFIAEQAMDYRKIGGIDNAVEILNLVNRSTERRLIKQLSEFNPEISDEIKKRMFVFEDIVQLDDGAIKKILREVDVTELAKALQNCDSEIVEKITGNMSKKGADSLMEEIELAKNTPQKAVEEYQLIIVSCIRRLEDCGDIVIARS